MNFLNFITAGASFFHFNLQNLASSSAQQQNINTSSLPNIRAEKQAVQMKHQMELLTQKQQLINQYMHMNIQLLSQKLENLQKNPKQSKQATVPNKDEQSQEIANNHKKNKKINKCGHNDRQHYAKGLCNNCYHKFGRNKKPWKCSHDKLYAAGMCQNCYINSYNKKKRQTRDSNFASQSELKVEEIADQDIQSSVQGKAENAHIDS